MVTQDMRIALQRKTSTIAIFLLLIRVDSKYPLACYRCHPEVYMTLCIIWNVLTYIWCENFQPEKHYFNTFNNWEVHVWDKWSVWVYGKYNTDVQMVKCTNIYRKIYGLMKIPTGHMDRWTDWPMYWLTYDRQTCQPSKYLPKRHLGL